LTYRLRGNYQQEKTGDCCEFVKKSKICDSIYAIEQTISTCGVEKNVVLAKCIDGCSEGLCISKGTECQGEFYEVHHGEGTTSFYCSNGHIGYSYGGMSGSYGAIKDPIDNFACLDSDGKDYAIGTVSVGYITEDKQKTGARGDSCVIEKSSSIGGVDKSNILREYICNENNILMPIFNDCKCENGACVN